MLQQFFNLQTYISLVTRVSCLECIDSIQHDDDKDDDEEDKTKEEDADVRPVDSPGLGKVAYNSGEEGWPRVVKPPAWPGKYGGLIFFSQREMSL